MPRDLGPQDPIGFLNARTGKSYARQYPYPVEGPRPRPWRRVANAIAPLLLAASIGTGLALVLIEWTLSNW